MPRAPTMRDLQSRLEGIEREIEKLSAQKEILLEMMGAQPEEPQRRAKKGSVKATVLKLLENAAERGLNANQAITQAKERGEDLDRGSVSSLLSRLKADNVVTYDGERYRLTKFVGARSDKLIVTPIRTSGGSVSG